MNILKLKFNVLKLMMIIVISVMAMSTASAQVIWDDQPSYCDENGKRSISAEVKNNTYSAGNFIIEVYDANTNGFIHGSHKVNLKENELKEIVLKGIPAGYFKVRVLKENADYMPNSKTFNFKPCFEKIVWDAETSECSYDNNSSKVYAMVTNNSNEDHKYKISMSGGHPGLSKTIKKGETLKIKGFILDLGFHEASIKRDGIVISTKNYRSRPCGVDSPPDEIEWAAHPGKCDQYKRRAIEATVYNNSKKQKSYKIKVFKQNNELVHAGQNISIAAKSKKTLSLGGIPAGYFRIQILNGADVIGSTNYVFENCDISPTQINKLTQVKNFEPFFTKLEQAFTINLASYFKSNECSNIAYNFKKLSPGINHQLSGTQLSIIPTPSFLGKSLLEITVQCDGKKMIETITIHTQVPYNFFNNCNRHVVNVGVLNFDPVMPNYGNKLCHDAFKDLCRTPPNNNNNYGCWTDPVYISEQYVDSMTRASGNYIYFNLVEWSYFNEFPKQSDGFQFDPVSYNEHYTKKAADRDAHAQIDYPKIVQEYGMVDLVNQKQVDEVWFSTGAVLGSWETSMAGPGAYYVNGGTYPEVESDRPFVILTLPQERGLSSFMHNNGHRAEDQISRAYNYKENWEGELNNWEKFTAFEAAFQGANAPAEHLEPPVKNYGVGTIHFPFNGTANFTSCTYGVNCGYDYDNDKKVRSCAYDFENYPNLANESTLFPAINAKEWGEDEVGYLNFWFGLLPKAEGINTDGRQNNWWKYIYDFNSYKKGGESINTKFRTNLYPDWQQFTEGVGHVLLFDLDDYYIDTDVALPQIQVRIHKAGINVYKIGTKVYAYIPPKSAGSYSCIISLCDGDYSYTKYVRLYINEAGYKIKNPGTIVKSSNYPNPFNTNTTISYTLPESSKVSIKIYNSLGEQIKVLKDNIVQQKGLYQINFDGSKYPSGIYYYGIQNNDHLNMHKMILMNDK